MKLKTRSSVKKRVKKTGSGKFVMDKAAKRHLLVNKSKKQKKKDAKGKLVDPSHKKALSRMLPNS